MLRKLAIVLAGILFVGLALEAALRLVPSAIPLFMLQHFSDPVRLEVADALGLPNRRIFVEVPRDDGGPPLRKLEPFGELDWAFGDVAEAQATTADAQGFCNPPSAPYDRSAIDLVAIGDSFTWCTEVEPGAAWPARLGEAVAMPSYNLGVPGAGPYEYLQILKLYGLAKAPKVVVMNIYEGNDLRNAQTYHWYRGGAPLEADPRGGWAPVDDWIADGWLGRNSYVLNILRALVLEPMRTSALSPETQQTPLAAAFRSLDNSELEFRYDLAFGDRTVPFNLQHRERDELAMALLMDRGLVDLGVFDEALESFVRLAREHGFVPLVTYTPAVYTAYAERVRFRDPSVAPIVARYSDAQRAYFRDGAERFGYRFLDLTRGLQARVRADGDAGADHLLYYPSSVHYSAEGNAEVAKLIAESLATKP